MAVRTAQLTDLSPLQEMLQELCEEEKRYSASQPTDFSYSREGELFLTQRITGNSGYAGILEAHGKPTGFILGSIDVLDTRWARIESTYVKRNARGNGFARELFTSFIAWAQTKGTEEISVGVLGHNVPAVSLYQALGFKAIEQSGKTVIMNLSLQKLHSGAEVA